MTVAMRYPALVIPVLVTGTNTNAGAANDPGDRHRDDEGEAGRHYTNGPMS